jgi:hypothetical protein
MTCRIVIMSVQVILIVVHSDGHDHDDGGDDDFNSNCRIRSDHDRNIDDLQSDNDSSSIATRTHALQRGKRDASLSRRFIYSIYIYICNVSLFN